MEEQMSILVVGSVAFDSIETPFGKAERALGGSATYFSVAASFFAPVQLVAVVGDDFGRDDMEVFRGRTIDTSGLSRVDGGKTFHWSGEYGFDLNTAVTRDTQLNVFADFRPILPDAFRRPDVVFLANIDPELQNEVLDQVRRPRLIALDTMNFWIESKPEALEKVIGRVDMMLINEGELRQYTNEPNLVKGARMLLDRGPERIVIKRGEYGVLMVTRDRIFAAPAYPLENVFDPTGAGDTFAGGFLGYLASSREHDDRDVRRAVVFGSVLASFNVESFSMDRLRQISIGDIERRYREFRTLTHFEDIPAARVPE
jgi:sugar/nucleoside kinase (ribokinase family)